MFIVWVLGCKLCPPSSFIDYWYTRYNCELGTRLHKHLSELKALGMTSTHSFLKSVVNMGVKKEKVTVNSGDNLTNVWENYTVWTVGECCGWEVYEDFRGHLLHSILAWKPEGRCVTFSGPLFSDISFQLKKKSELKVLLIKLKNENARMSRRSLASTISFCPFQFNMKIISRNWHLKVKSTNSLSR